MFYKAELSLLRAKYFKVLHETAFFVEVESKNTHHRWSIIKTRIATDSYPIVLYHNHNTKTSSYHKHAVSRSVKHAVSLIKKHDDYILEKAKRWETKTCTAKKGT